jgi:hypothetical protein
MNGLLPRGSAPYAFDITPGASIAADAANTKGYDTCHVYTKTAGNVTVTTADGQSITFASVPAYTLLGGLVPILVRAVTASAAACVGLVVKNNN